MINTMTARRSSGVDFFTGVLTLGYVLGSRKPYKLGTMVWV
jgi:hypothetical protein